MVVEKYPGIDRAMERKYFGSRATGDEPAKPGIFNKPRFSVRKYGAWSKAQAEKKYGEKPLSVEAAKGLLQQLKTDQEKFTATSQKMFLDNFLTRMEDLGWSVDNLPANVFSKELIKKIKTFPVTFVVKQNNGKEFRAVAEQSSDMGEALSDVLKNGLVFIGAIAQVEVYEGKNSIPSHYIMRAPIDYPLARFAVDKDAHQDLGEMYKEASILYREKNYVNKMRDWMVELIAGMGTETPIVDKNVLPIISEFLKVDSSRVDRAFLESQLPKVSKRIDAMAKNLKEIRQAPENRTYLLVSEGEAVDVAASA
jgi:hypothetical protein